MEQPGSVSGDPTQMEVERSTDSRNQGVASFFARSKVAPLPNLTKDLTSKFLVTGSGENGGGTRGLAGRGFGLARRRASSFKLVPDLMPNINENNSVSDTSQTTSHHHAEARKCRLKSIDSETITSEEDEEIWKAFTKSRRAARRRTSNSRDGRGGGERPSDAELPPNRKLMRRRSTRFSLGQLGLDEVEGSSVPSFSRRLSVRDRMSEWRRISFLVQQQEEIKKRAKARKRFIHAAKMVIILNRVYKIIFKTKQEAEKVEPMTFTSLAEEYQSDNMKLSGLSFDRNYFKVKKEVGLTPEVKNILSTPSHSRSKEQLGTALIGLQTMKSFAEYPLHMQEKLVKVAWYEFIPPKRVIIRQGHYAENFYFVISGSVVVTILTTNADTGETTVRTAAVLRRGSSFGEIAILHHGRRTATVSSQGPVDLLAITREDFFDIFMRGQAPGQEPEHISFLRQLNFMKYWPIEILLGHPEMCLFHFYKRGQVIVRDSNKSDWIYVVKSGTCQVLMQLKAAKRHVTDKSRNGNNSRMVANTLDYDARKGRRKTMSLPDIEPLKLAAPKKFLLGNNRPQLTLQHMDIRSISESSTFLTRAKGLSESDDEESESLSGHLTPGQVIAHVPTILPDIDLRKGATPSQQSFSPSTFREYNSKRPSRASSRNHHKSKSVSPPNINYPEPADVRQRRASVPMDTRKDVSVFIQVELLQPKDCFGLSSLDLELGFDTSQSSVSLVSRGAECIMIKKDFLVKHATSAVKRNIRSMVYPYPSAETLQQNLQSHTDWSHYKEETLTGILGDKSRSRDLKT
ncbi:uncharacterized protein [Diadema antillarum]|uniref:uncharacterized protein n=1 Tax=Diadema antillarum TaxID=105358 RepID=UPI003A87AF75